MSALLAVGVEPLRSDLERLGDKGADAADSPAVELALRCLDLIESGGGYRTVNQLRAQMLDYVPALERAFDYSVSQAALILLTGYQTPDGLRRLGRSRLETWLRNHKARNAATIAERAISAANAQHTVIAGQHIAAEVVSRLAKEVMALDHEIHDTDKMIEERFRRHRHAAIITSMPGFGPTLGAEFLAATGGHMSAFPSANQLAAVAGLAPVPRDSGRISGNLRRPRRYDRRLLRALYLSAMISITNCPASRIYYDRKRREGKRHTQAVLALARRRVNVLWAMLRDHTPYQPISLPSAA